MDRLPEWLLLARDDQRVRTGAVISATVIYYVVCLVGAALGGYSFSGGWIIVVAVPGALVIPWFRTRPMLALGMSGLGMLLVLLANTNVYNRGVFFSQVSILLAVFGASMSSNRRVRSCGIGLIALAAIVALTLSGNLLFPVTVVVFCGLSVVAATAWRQTAANWTITAKLSESIEREQHAERDVAVEQERNRIARDVHDVVAHSLAVVIAQADGARYAAKANPKSVGPALETIADTARTALGEVRVLLHELRHEQGSAPTPGTADIDALVDGVRELGLTVEMVTYGQERALGDATQLAVYRIVQEALTNALRHGDPSEPVGLDFDWGDHGVTVVVTNTLPAAGVPQIDGPGHGIPGMRERAALAGGELTVGVGNRGLFRVRATLPAPVSATADTLLMPARV